MDESPTRPFGARRLISGAFFLFCARLVTMALGLAQAILLAKKFGTSTGADAYFVANAVCGLFVGPTQVSLNMAVVPVFVHAAQAEGKAAAWKIVASLCRVGLVGLGGVSLLLVAGAGWLAPLLAPGFDAGGMTLVATFLRVLVPTILLLFLAAFLSTMNYIAGRYLLPAIAMTVQAMAGPLGLVFFADRFGVLSLGYGIVAGSVVCCILLLVGSPEAHRLMGPAVPFRDPALKKIGRTILSRVLTSWCIDLNLMTDRIFASFLGPGFISSLAYANRAVMAIVNAVVMPIGRVLMPALSRMSAQHRYERMREVLEKLMIGVGFLAVPLVAFIVAFRVELLSLVFKRGAFDASSLEATAVALLFYSLGILPFLVIPILNGVFFSLQDSATPLKIGVLSVVANVLLDATLIVVLGHGGIALATSVVGAIRGVLLWSPLRRKIGALRSASVLGSLLVSAGAAACAFWVAEVLVSWTGSEWPHPLWRLGAYAVVGSAVYLLLQGIFNRPVARLIPSVVGRYLWARAS